ncbi:MAG: hypothetical protein MJZ76_06755 [Bacteroidales bacterium]|nr:hypothetical protein [Bacteroidales bacterium]
MKSKLSISKKKSSYDWQFANVGGVTRVNIASGNDIAHLDELDQKMWTALSCPTKGLEFDPKTLEMLDTDNDGRIRVNEVIAAAKWLTSLLKDSDRLLLQEDYIPLDAINTENEEGAKILASIKQVLQNLGAEKDTISVADSADSIAIFNKTRFNGDGVVTENCTDNPELKKVIKEAMDCCGAMPDLSGDNGIDSDHWNSFFEQCQAYKTWYEDGIGRSEKVFPYGEADTSAALDVYLKLKDKIDDFFMRCKLVAFDKEAQQTLDVSVARMEEISAKNLSECTEEIASYPIARINPEALLAINGTINPAWQDLFNTFDNLVLKHYNTNQELTSMSESLWQEIGHSFDSFIEWQNSKAGAEIESLGYARIKEIVEQNSHSEILSLIEQDKALENKAKELADVDKFLHLYRDFYVLLKNFVTFIDFYDKDQKNNAIFQAGTLYIDQRCCKLCMKVSDMPKHNTMASFSGMYLIYCDCFSKVKNETMSIVAALTNGEVRDIIVGKNAIFYDRNGLDWDAHITKIIENPISIKEAIWSPYRKFGRFIETQINKMAASQDDKMSSSVTGKISESGETLTSAELKDKKTEKQPLDIAKFCGIFAAIGLALGYIGGFLVDIFYGFIHLTWWQMPLSIIGIMLLISGPSMLIAWLKLRKRNLAPVLDSNGWAINAEAYVSIPFGYTLTDMATFPKMKLQDPFDKSKKTPVWKKLIYWIVFLGVVFGVLYFTNVLSYVGLPFRSNETVTEEVANEAAVVDSTAVPADTTIAAVE